MAQLTGQGWTTGLAQLLVELHVAVELAKAAGLHDVAAPCRASGNSLVLASRNSRVVRRVVSTGSRLGWPAAVG